MKRIGVLTRDCAGINAAIRSVVRSASVYDIEVVGIYRGYQGLIEGDLGILTRRSVSGIINVGGTILKTVRSDEFRTPKGQLKAVKTIVDNRIDATPALPIVFNKSLLLSLLTPYFIASVSK